MSPAGGSALRCPALRRDGQPCRGRPGPSGFCIGHGPGADAARRQGGRATALGERAGRLLPARLRPVSDLLTRALTEVHEGQITPSQATALSSLSTAILRLYQAADLEERLRALEELNS